MQCGLQAACCQEHVARGVPGDVLRAAAEWEWGAADDGGGFCGEIELVDAVGAEVAGVGDGAGGVEDSGVGLCGGLQWVRAAACLLEGVWGGEDGSV